MPRLDRAPETRRSAGAPESGVLVADADRERLLRLTHQLTRAGFVVIPCTNWLAAVDIMTKHAIQIGVVDASIADLSHLLSQQRDAGQSQDRVNQTRELPLIILVPDAETFDWDTYAALDSADYVMLPTPVPELVQRVRALARRLDLRAQARTRAAELRTAVQAISAAISATNDPMSMIQRLVEGVADVFGAVGVCFASLEDARVPELSFQWRRDAPSLLPLELASHEAGLRTLAADLWDGRRTLNVDDLGTDNGTGRDLDVVRWALEPGARALLAVPVGHGDSAFGMIWIATHGPRRWSPIEVALMQHLANNAAQALMQGQVITAQEEAVNRLRRLDDAKNDFLTTVNHELRTPLTSLTAYLQLIQEGAGGKIPGQALDMLQVVERNAKRLSQLVDDILTISRMTANEPRVNWTHVDITQLLRGLVAAMQQSSSTQHVQLVLSPGCPSIIMEGDAAQLGQVFRNIVDNALKFTPPNGRVDVTVDQHVGVGGVNVVSVTITDNGIGIPESDLPDLFTSFFRGSQARADAVAGSGLGLAIVRGLVDAHGGTISVSAAAGEGTTVVVRLPVDSHAQSAGTLDRAEVALRNGA